MAAAARGKQNFGECSPQLTAHRLAAEFQATLYAGSPSIESPARPKYARRAVSSSRLASINEVDTNAITITNESSSASSSNTNRMFQLMNPSNSSGSNSIINQSSSSSNTLVKKRRTVPTVCLLHGLHDTTVPPSATEHFTVAISGLLGAENVHTVYTKV